MFGRRERGHVDADLGDQHLGGALLDAGDASSAGHAGGRKGRSAPRSRPTAGRSPRRGSRCARGSGRRSARARRRSDPSSASRSAGSFLRSCPRASSASTAGSVVPATSASSIVAAGLAEDVRRDAVELDPGVLEDLVQPRQPPAERSLICALRYRVRFRSVRIGLGGTKLAFNSPASNSWHSHCASLMSVLRPGTCFTAPGVDEHQLEAILEHRPHRLPIHAGGLHRDLLDPERLQPVAQRQQTLNRRLELRQVLLKLASLPDPHARGHARLVHVERARALNDPAPSPAPFGQIDNDHRPRELRIHKRCCSACSRQQSGVPAKAPTPDFAYGLTSTKAKSASANGRAHRSPPHPARATTATPISFPAGGEAPPSRLLCHPLSLPGFDGGSQTRVSVLEEGIPPSWLLRRSTPMS